MNLYGFWNERFGENICSALLCCTILQLNFFLQPVKDIDNVLSHALCAHGRHDSLAASTHLGYHVEVWSYQLFNLQISNHCS